MKNTENFDLYRKLQNEHFKSLLKGMLIAIAVISIINMMALGITWLSNHTALGARLSESATNAYRVRNFIFLIAGEVFAASCISISYLYNNASEKAWMQMSELLRKQKAQQKALMSSDPKNKKEKRGYLCDIATELLNFKALLDELYAGKLSVVNCRITHEDEKLFSIFANELTKLINDYETTLHVESSILRYKESPEQAKRESEHWKNHIGPFSSHVTYLLISSEIEQHLKLDFLLSNGRKIEVRNLDFLEAVWEYASRKADETEEQFLAWKR